MAVEGVGKSDPSAVEDPNIVQSPFAEELVVPDVPLTTFLFDALKRNSDAIKDRILVIDAVKGISIKYNEVEKLSKQFASALTRKGFKKGDVLYYVTYDYAQIYVIQIGVWLCGGAVRGCFQKEEKEEYERQMKQTRCRFILVEPETAAPVKWAAGRLGWQCQMLSIGGEVEGATPAEDMIYKDDGSAFPMDVKINPREDVVCIPNTNGSTGLPKGAAHTHYNFVSLLVGAGAPFDWESEAQCGKTIMSLMGNFLIGCFLMDVTTFILGYTYIAISKFDHKSFFQHVHTYKPNSLLIYPYVANWFVRSPELDTRNLSYIKEFLCGGSVFDYTTLSMLSKKFPHAEVQVFYGMTELLIISSPGMFQYSKIVIPEVAETIAGLKLDKFGEELNVSCGPLVSRAEAKIVDIDTGKSVGRRNKGKLLVRVPFVMKGYLLNDGKGYSNEVDDQGWFDTGDIGYFDEDGHLYIIDRMKQIFKYYMHHVSPADLERVIGEHPAVQSVGVVGLPNPATTSVARAYIVVKPGCIVTEEEIKQHVADKTPSYKHLHGGVAFVEKLPESRGGKLNRSLLLQQAIEELNHGKPTK